MTFDPDTTRRAVAMQETTLTLVGNLTAPPELRFTSSGRAVCSFTVASTSRKYDKGTSQWVDGDTLFLRCQLWGQPAENVAGSDLQAGQRMVVVGRLGQRSYETKDGEKRTVYEVTCDEVGPSLRYATAAVQRVARLASVPAPEQEAQPA